MYACDEYVWALLVLSYGPSVGSLVESVEPHWMVMTLIPFQHPTGYTLDWINQLQSG